MSLNHWERLTLLAIHDGDAGPHRVSVLNALLRKGLINNRQGLTPAGLRLAVEEVTRQREAEIRRMRDKIREHRRRFGR